MLRMKLFLLHPTRPILENYEYNYEINALIKKVSAVQEETNILQETMEEEVDEIVSSLDEKDEEESK